MRVRCVKCFVYFRVFLVLETRSPCLFRFQCTTVAPDGRRMRLADLLRGKPGKMARLFAPFATSLAEVLCFAECRAESMLLDLVVYGGNGGGHEFTHLDLVVYSVQ